VLTCDIETYKLWRKQWLAQTDGQILDTPRGPCIVGPRLHIVDNVQPDWHMKDRAIEDAEYNLIYIGQDMEPAMKAKLYGDDEKLYREYKSLSIVRLGMRVASKEKRPESRKNIIFNKECCLAYWQLHKDTLTVISRSWDIQRAGLSDLVIVNRVAAALHCAKFELISLCTHAYVDRDHIARRYDEAARI
jgi:hypothetical protein